MRYSRAVQSLSYPLRLPDALQADALRLLTHAREVINLTITSLWPRLDEFTLRTNSYAYKQVETMMPAPQADGHRLWRCEAEQAGRILRGQAERKQQFVLILPLLSEGMVIPKSEKRRAGKNRKSIREAVAALRDAASDGGNAVELQSLLEQACNYYLENGCFPDTYEEMQQMPVLSAGILPYAGDDGPAMGQTYRMSVDLDKKQITLALRAPDSAGNFVRNWRSQTSKIPLPEVVVERAKQGAMQAPLLREVVEADGSSYAVLDCIVEVPVEPSPTWDEMSNVLGFDWGIRQLVTASILDLDGHQVARPFFLDTGPLDGRQARTRRQIDQLKAKMARLEEQRKRFPAGDPRRAPSDKAIPLLKREIARCWRKYEARNNDLAHLAANVLLALATAFDCQLIAGESLKTMKSAGRGKGTKGRWRNWRNNSQVRGELWRILRYKCFLAGIKLEWQQSRHTSHTCPRCGQLANTYSSPARVTTVNDWGAWLWCSNPACHWNGSRDYAASLNIARLAVAMVLHAQATARLLHISITNASVQPVSYMGTWAQLRLPALASRGHLSHSGRIYVNGWCLSVKLRSSYETAMMLRFSS